MKEFILEVLAYRENNDTPEFKVKWNDGDVEWVSDNTVYEEPLYHEPGEKPDGPMTQLLKKSYEEPPDKIIPLLRRFFEIPDEFFTITFDYTKEETLTHLISQGTLNLSGNDAITELQKYLREYNRFKKRRGKN